MTYTIWWESRCRAANLRVNPTEKDNNTVICSGFSKVIARTRDDAITLFQLAFPYDRITEIN